MASISMNSSSSVCRKLLVVLAVVFLALGLVPAQGAGGEYPFYTVSKDARPYPPAPDGPVRNVVLLIGDGMGVSQVTAASIRAGGADGRLYMERMPVVGLAKTHSAGELVTDSAAAATALATGRKTNNGKVSVAPNGKKLLTILEAAARKGMATGLVVTSSITHATPAAFAAHVNSRSDEAEIAAQILNDKVTVLLGGGRSFFLPKSEPGSARNDARNLLAEAKKAGYSVVQDKQQFESAANAPLLGLFQLGALTTHTPEPSLAELTGKAIGLLSRNKTGFFLMVEGSQIDWAAHGGNSDETVRQTLLMDEAVKVALDFAAKDRRTLVLVTADHETGGMAIVGGALDGAKIDVKWLGGSHTAEPAPIYAFGPQARRFTGVLNNTDIPRLLSRLLGVESLPHLMD